MSYIQTMPEYYIETSSPVTRPCPSYAFPIDPKSYVIPHHNSPMKTKASHKPYMYTDVSPCWYQCYTLPACPALPTCPEDEEIYPRDSCKFP